MNMHETRKSHEEEDEKKDQVVLHSDEEKRRKTAGVQPPAWQDCVMDHVNVCETRKRSRIDEPSLGKGKRSPKEGHEQEDEKEDQAVLHADEEKRRKTAWVQAPAWQKCATEDREVACAELSQLPQDEEGKDKIECSMCDFKSFNTLMSRCLV